MGVLRRAFLAGLSVLGCAALDARDYYVSATGSDAAAGTLAQPFLTIQKAASAMVAGDTAYIRAGVYRETVTPRISGTQSAPITFRSYNGEIVTVSGADVISPSGWSLSSGNIYKASQSWNLGDGSNQVFLDGKMMIEARWPNTTLDVSRPVVGHTTGGSSTGGASGNATGTIDDVNLPSRSAGYWNGAALNICMGPCWTWQAGPITNSSNPRRLVFNFSKQGDELVPTVNNSYFLTGKLGELDAPGEWFRDASTSTLYLWTPAGDNPFQHSVEAKRRQLAFDLSGRSYIQVQGLGIFAATIATDANSQYLVLDGLDCRYIAHSPLPLGQDSYEAGSEIGIALRGKNNVLRNSTISFSSGSGVYLEGTGQRVFNNAIRDSNYYGSYASPVFAGTSQTSQTLQSQHLIAYNTISNSGRFGIYHPENFGTGRILHNDISHFGLQTNDLGCTYAWNTDGRGTEIAYNLCHDGHGMLLPPATSAYVAGIYLDNGSRNFVIHHNVVWNTAWGLHLNDPSTNEKVYNNTFVGTDSSFLPYGDDRLTGTEVKNNIFISPIRVNPIGAVLTNNILPSTDPQFVDPARNNFQLKPASPAIGAGAVIPPYTDGFTGAAPDIGAYDHTKPPWKAGTQAAAYAVSAASYAPALAPGSAAVVFGTIPFDSGVSVTVTDGAGVDRPAKLLYVVTSPPQLAFEVPSTAAVGVAMVTITNTDGALSLGSAPVFLVAPGLISADASGTGLAAAGVQRVRADGTQTLGTAAAGPIDLSSAGDQVYLILYGTGIRGRSALNRVAVTAGGVDTPVLYAGAQNQFPGLDQVNILLPNTLAGRGIVNISLTVDGQPSNTVTITVK